MYIAFAIYIMLLIWVIVFKWTNYIAAQECIITFRKLDLAERFLACKKSFIGFDFSDLILNILLFLPMGSIFAPLFKKKYLILIIAVACSLVFEISQFFTCIGMSNIFDFLGNIVGCVIGFAIFLLLEKRITKRFIDITNIVVIIVGAPLCIYAIVMTIINFHYYL
jgi:glycopeptide antibiotics resistance protein